MTDEHPPRPPRSSRVRTRRAALERAEAKAARLQSVYSALTTVHTLASQARSSDELFGRACEALVKGAVYQSAWAGRFNDDGDISITSVAGEFPHPPPTQVLAVDAVHGWLQAVETNKPVALRNTGDGSRKSEILSEMGLSDALVVPVSMDPYTHGVLCIGSNPPEVFDSDEIALLLELGRALSTHAERIAAEHALAAQRELLRAVFDCASYGIYYATAEGKILLCNDAFMRLSGTSRTASLRESYNDTTPDEFRQMEHDILERVLATGLPSEYDKELLRADGFRIPVRVSVAPVREHDGHPVGTVAVVRDTVAERESAKALRESEERYRSAFRNNPDAIFVADARGRIVEANPAASRLTGVERAELQSRPLVEFIASNDQEDFLEAQQELIEQGEMCRSLARFANQNGEIISTEVFGTALAPRLWQLLVRDIRERQEAEGKLLGLKDELEEKVVARTKELKEANVALAHAGRMKDQFLANMSHELRTPLNAVIGLADALLEGVYGDLDEQQRQILMTVHDSGHHLLELINDILDLSKIDAGRLEVDMRTVSVSEVCQVSLRMVRPLAIGKRIGTWMRTDPQFPVVVADERRLKQMLVNLLSNAVKFTLPGGQAGIEAWSHDEQVFFSVTDTGIGISPHDLRRIFEPFTQIDSSLTRQQEGTGLGLALVRRLAELHGGRIDVDSEPGKGSRFTIVLPRIMPPDRESLLPMESPDDDGL